VEFSHLRRPIARAGCQRFAADRIRGMPALIGLFLITQKDKNRAAYRH
jgi:hypothetical protein